MRLLSAIRGQRSLSAENEEGMHAQGLHAARGTTMPLYTEGLLVIRWGNYKMISSICLCVCMNIVYASLALFIVAPNACNGWFCLSVCLSVCVCV